MVRSYLGCSVESKIFGRFFDEMGVIWQRSETAHGKIALIAELRP